MEADFILSLENENTLSELFDSNSKFYLIGGGLSSLAAATYLIKIAEVRGDSIYIFDESENLTNLKSNEKNYLIHGHSWIDSTCFCTYDLLSLIPSEKNGMTLLDELLSFKKEHPISSKSKILKNKKNLTNPDLSLNKQDRWDLINLMLKRSEKSLEGQSIDNIFQDSFLESNFWKIWSANFGFKPEHSAIEFRRYLNRFLQEVPQLSTFSGMTPLPNPLAESVILPLKRWLSKQGVTFISNSEVIKLELDNADNNKKIISKIHYLQDNQPKTIRLTSLDYAFTTIGSISEKMSIGTMDTPPQKKSITDCWKLWKNLSNELPDLGNPLSFLEQNNAGCCYFTIVCNSSFLFKKIEKITKYLPGENGIMTIADSNWDLSVCIPHQPYFKSQGKDEFVLWGYGANMHNSGNFINKKMHDCSGKEILSELCWHLGINEDYTEIIQSTNCQSCYLPLGGSALLPRYKTDRPPLTPDSCVNLACIGQFSEQSTEPTSTIEYSIRCAQKAVIERLGLYHDTPQVYHGYWHLRALYKAGKSLFPQKTPKEGANHV